MGMLPNKKWEPDGPLTYIGGKAYLLPGSVRVNRPYCNFEPQCSTCAVHDRCTMVMNKTMRSNFIVCHDRVYDGSYANGDILWGPHKGDIDDVRQDLAENIELFTQEEIDEANATIAWLEAFSDPEFPINER